MDAYDIAEEISHCANNYEWLDFVRNLATDLAETLGHSVIEQDIELQSKYGNKNIIVDSGEQSPILITAHYDAVVLDELTNRTTPGANDNGSGVGAAYISGLRLAGYPVDIIFFGGEEQGCFGAKTYIEKTEKTPQAVINLDTCGSGGDLGILIPNSVYVEEESGEYTERKLNFELNSMFTSVAKEKGYKTFHEDPQATGDHGPFIKAGIPATTIQGENMDFYGLVDGEYQPDKMVMHTDNDTIEWVDERFLGQVVDVVVEGIKSYLSK